MRRRVLVGMSGGVDSSVTAALLVQAGYEVIGVAMRLWGGPAAAEGHSGCCSLDDFLDARRVAHRLGIRFYVMDFQDEFERSVVDPFVGEYARGRTPNPCVRCNQFVKFGAFWDRARELGAAAVATGHYAQVRRSAAGAPELWRGADAQKDQSYFLFAVPRPQLAHTLFPVGQLTKAQVRGLAAEMGLSVAAKPDSQEVCFAPGRAHGDFVAGRLGGEAPGEGEVIDASGTVVGRHRGVHTVTVGQRRGLGLQGVEPRYVTDIDPASGTVRVGNAGALEARGLHADGVNWLVDALPAPGTVLTLQIRSRHAAAPVRVTAADDRSFSVEGGGLRAVTPGQAAVLYDGDRVVGGGWIREALR
jgi:tRNA-specific 2-thiouridylase